MIPLYDENRPQKKPFVNYALILINITVFFFFLLTGNLLRGIKLYGAVPAAILGGSRLWTIFTSMFMHADIMHLAGNMLYLWIFIHLYTYAFHAFLSVLHADSICYSGSPHPLGWSFRSHIRGSRSLFASVSRRQNKDPRLLLLFLHSNQCACLLLSGILVSISAYDGALLLDGAALHGGFLGSHRRIRLRNAHSQRMPSCPALKRET